MLSLFLGVASCMPKCKRKWPNIQKRQWVVLNNLMTLWLLKALFSSSNFLPLSAHDPVTGLRFQNDCPMWTKHQELSCFLCVMRYENFIASYSDTPMCNEHSLKLTPVQCVFTSTRLLVGTDSSSCSSSYSNNRRSLLDSVPNHHICQSVDTIH